VRTRRDAAQEPAAHDHFVARIGKQQTARGGLWLQNAVATIISFASVGIYMAFQMLVLGALIARSKGWIPTGPFTLGRWGWPVNLIGFAYGVSAIFDMMWPRAPQDPWYSDYGMIVTAVGVIVLGTVYMLTARPYERGNAPAGDAHRLQAQARVSGRPAEAQVVTGG
jgi:amino acid transporter